jgi:hypothetical protein
MKSALACLSASADLGGATGTGPTPAERLEFAALGAELALTAVQAQPSAGSGLWHAAVDRLPPLLGNLLAAGLEVEAASDCLAWLALRAPPAPQAAEQLAGALISSGLMRALVPLCVKQQQSATAWCV